MTRLLPAALLAATLPAGAVHAEEWKHEVAPYVFGAAMDGRTGVGNAVVDVNASFSDIVENLETGFMGAYRGTYGRYSITFDGIFMALGANGRGPSGFVSGDVDLDQLALEADFGYALTEQFTVFAGLRYNDLSVKTKVVGPLGERRREGDESWIDPVVGAHFTLPLSDQWSVNLRGDVGGFGVGSDLAWQGIATLRWQATASFGVLAAYRYIQMDYEDGSGNEAFIYDVSISGPALGVVFTF
jgi:opacity protein-like surface antigen